MYASVSVFLKALVLTALIILFMYNVITLNLLIFGIYMFRRNLLILWVIGTVAGCSNVSESDARYLDTYSLCYEVGDSAPAYRSATLEVVRRTNIRRNAIFTTFYQGLRHTAVLLFGILLLTDYQLSIPTN